MRNKVQSPTRFTAWMHFTMGQYLNPSADVFAESANSPAYVDKTALIVYTNGVMGTSGRLICSCRPPRFGKSCDARMLAAYYSKGANSKALFDRLQIAQLTELPFMTPAAKFVPYETYLNRLDVIYLGLGHWRPSLTDDFLKELQNTVIAEVRAEIPEVRTYRTSSLPDMLSYTADKTGRPGTGR